MRESTRIMKAEMQKDIRRFHQVSRKRLGAMTEAQREQHSNDRATYYRTKWERMKEQAETKAQKEYCNNVLWRIPGIL